MDIEVNVKITAPDGTAHTEKIASITKGADTIGEIGLSIGESKDLLLQLQQEIVSAQCHGILRDAFLLPELRTKTPRKGTGPDPLSHRFRRCHRAEPAFLSLPVPRQLR